jgi:voltage-gated potassium channel
VEYVLRLVTCTESRKYNKDGAVLGRLRYVVTPAAVIDCLATFPFFVERFTGWDLPTLTYLRVFRLLRIGKTQGYGRALDAVCRVVYYNREILHVAVLVCTFLVLFTAILMYYLRPQNPDDAQDFTSIAATMYLSTLMLTGQGGPDGDLPWYTKSVVLLTGVFSVAMFAIPVSVYFAILFLLSL